MLLPKHQIPDAVKLLREGKLVAFPTETVYGLGAPIFSPDLIEEIFKAKGRPHDNPLIVHISNFEQLALIAQNIPEDFYRLADAFFPGPLTVILEKKKEVPEVVSGGLSTIGVRMPKNGIALELIEGVGVPLVAPSANLSGRPSATKASHVLDDFGDKIGGVIDGGACEFGIESTVLTLSPEPRIFRPGAISRAAIEEVLGREVAIASTSCAKPPSPGMKYRHYAPKGVVRLFRSMEKLREHEREKPSISRLVLERVVEKELYSSLREGDTQGCDEILVFCDRSTLQNEALMNRLMRASQ